MHPVYHRISSKKLKANNCNIVTAIETAVGTAAIRFNPPVTILELAIMKPLVLF